VQEITVALPGRMHTYHVLVGSGLLERVAELLHTDQYSKVFVVTDEHMEKLWLPRLQKALPDGHEYLALPSGEDAKRMSNVERIWTALRQAGCDRHSLVVILGGGVTGDMGAFAASTYERGVAFAHIPTTLLAQVDSSIGGKTGVDFDGLKNLVGTFAEPVAVVSDTDILATLPKRELVAGFGEMLKHGLIKDAAYFEALTKKQPAVYTAGELEVFIAKSVKIKAGVVEGDETEAGERKLVNFGHTVGHAVEALSWKTERPLLHGEAVAIGLVVEADLSCERGFISEAEVRRVKQAVEFVGLPSAVPDLPVERIMEKMRADKKDERGVIKFDLLEAIGRAAYDQTVDDSAVEAVLRRHMGPGNAA
jgi:3-dehydroquinate synthase